MNGIRIQHRNSNTSEGNDTVDSGSYNTLAALEGIMKFEVDHQIICYYFLPLTFCMCMTLNWNICRHYPWNFRAWRARQDADLECVVAWHEDGALDSENWKDELLRLINCRSQPPSQNTGGTRNVTHDRAMVATDEVEAFKGKAGEDEILRLNLSICRYICDGAAMEWDRHDEKLGPRVNLKNTREFLQKWRWWNLRNYEN